jgi:aminoglycoside 6'-N-acetyltransferase
MESERAELMAFYRRYLECCNDHRFEELHEFLDEDVQVNGTAQGVDQYVSGLRAVVQAFPDYHWDLRRLLVDGDWLSAHLHDTGTHVGAFRGVPATGRSISTPELAIYRVDNGRIVECWGDLGSAVRDQLTWGTSDERSGPTPVLRGGRVMLRPSRDGDAERLLRIRNEPSVWRWWRDAELADVEADLLGRNGDQLLVIEVDQQVAGGIQYSEENEPDYRHAGIDIFLATAAQSRGLGGEAIRLLAGYLIRERGHHRLVIDPAADNYRAIRCYAAVGFRPVGIMRRYERGSDGSWHDGLLMELLADEFEPSSDERA